MSNFLKKVQRREKNKNLSYYYYVRGLLEWREPTKEVAYIYCQFFIKFIYFILFYF
jgi:hypothetical protein